MMIEPPSWVRKRDGRVVPFDPEQISQSVFEAAESLDCSDVFLARELANSITHFLADEAVGQTITSGMIEEVIVKVVRELGHPQLAQALDAQTRQEDASDEDLSVYTTEAPIAKTAEDASRLCLQNWSMEQIFSRELTRAQNEGLILLAGREAPDRLAGGLLDLTSGLMQGLAEASRILGRVLVVESAESLIEEVSDLHSAAELANREIILNVNAHRPPSKVDSGPLFAEEEPIDPIEQSKLGDRVLEQIVHPHRRGDLTLDWHLSKSDLARSRRARLLRVARFACARSIRFVFDRPRKPIWLAEGIQARHPYVLQVVGLNLWRLAQLGADRFFDNLDNLCRMALSAGIQKREHLRRQSAEQPELGRAFLTQRARLLVTPVGLEKAVRHLSGQGLSHSEALAMACRILESMRSLLQEEGRRCAIHSCVDSSLSRELKGREDEGGVTCWNATPPSVQIETMAKLHEVTGGGTGVILTEETPSAEQVVDWIQKAWQSGTLHRLQILPIEPEGRQLTFTGTFGLS